MDSRFNSDEVRSSTVSGESPEEGFRDFAESLVQNIDEVFFWRNPGCLTPYFVSHSYERIWGWPCATVYEEPSSWIESIHPDDREFVLREMELSGQSGHGQVEYRIIRPDGNVRWIWARTFPMEGGGEIRRLIGVAQDCTERKQADSAQSFLASIVESSDDSIIGTDLDGMIRSWNRGAEKLFGYTHHEVIGKSVTILFPPTQQQDYLNGVLSKVDTVDAISRFETVRIARDGTPIDVSTILSPIRDGSGKLQGISGIYRDIRIRKQLEKERDFLDLQLRHAQKLESVGRLAAGIAHEINTPCQFVSDSVYFVRDGMKDLIDLIQKYRQLSELCAADGKVTDLIGQIRSAEESVELPYLLEQIPLALTRALDGMDRVAGIVRSMKEFSYPDQTEKSIVDLNRSIESTLTVARNEYKYVADLETEFGDLPDILCYPGEVNQVILNIVVNASHAIADVVTGTDQKGQIRVRTWREGEAVVVTIQDTGTGIPAEIRDRIFEPFFTTKDIGRGTGQGLAIARSVIVDKHGGTLEFESEAGRGTTFIIRLPITEKSIETMGVR